jgi:hypothetical protein
MNAAPIRLERIDSQGLGDFQKIQIGLGEPNALETTLHFTQYYATIGGI